MLRCEVRSRDHVVVKKHAVEFASFSKPPVWMTGLMMAKSISSSSSRTSHMLRLPRGRKPRNPEVNFLPDWPGHFFDPHPCLHQQAPREIAQHELRTCHSHNTTKHHAIQPRIASQSVVAVYTSCNLSSCVEGRNGLGIRTQHC